METQKYLDMLREAKNASIATVAKNGTPRVRIAQIMLVEDEKIYFITARGKEFHDELEASGNVAITCLISDKESVSVRGKVKNIGREKLDEIFNENPHMNDIYPGPSRYILDVFCLYEGEGEYFSIASAPIERQAFPIGKSTVKRAGYQITSKCATCGACLSVCPQKCITEGRPYSIKQEHCLRCGRCAERCPNSAIVRI